MNGRAAGRTVAGMTIVLDTQRPDESVALGAEFQAVGPVGRLGRFAAEHVRAITVAWVIVAVALAAFAPKVETALSGAGWQADGSESVRARALIGRKLCRAIKLGADWSSSTPGP